VEKTYVIKGTPQSEWILVDADGQSLGRLATQIASYLLGKHKPNFTPGSAMGDFVVVVNVSKLKFAQKKLDTKNYYHHSGYPGGLSTIVLGDLMQKNPERVIEKAVKGMLPKNKLGRQLMTRLKIYRGSEHPHAAQHPTTAA
jgi:large subunit ribosomal protein L13